MPRVHTRTRTRGGHKTYTCQTCHTPIEPGTKFYTWTRRFGRSGQTYYQHSTCGYPRPTQLSSRKTAVVEEAIGVAETDINGWTFEWTFDPADYVGGGTLTVEVDGITTTMEDVAGEAENVADEYESGADNMPDSLQYGSQAEAMREVAGELRDWADTVRDWDSSLTTDVEIPDPAEFVVDDDETAEDYDPDEAIDKDAWEEAAQAALDTVVEEIREAAMSAFEDLPEYQG